MSASVLSTLVLFALAGRAPGESRPLPALASDSGDAWVVLLAGSAWVCWSAFEPDCWQRIELEPPAFDHPPAFAAALVPEDDLDASTTNPLRIDPTQAVDPRFGFEPGRLWITIDDQFWVVEPDQRQARLVDTVASSVALVRPTPPSCGPRRQVPAVISGRLSFVDADPCPASRSPLGCVRPRLRVRRPSGVELRAGLSLGHVRSWVLDAAQPDLGLPAQLQTRAGVELLAVVELGFDGPAAVRLARSRAELLARDRQRQAWIPEVEEGPLAAAELDALTDLACSEAQ